VESRTGGTNVELTTKHDRVVDRSRAGAVVTGGARLAQRSVRARLGDAKVARANWSDHVMTGQHDRLVLANVEEETLPTM
jgi:hypothetical protein